MGVGVDPDTTAAPAALPDPDGEDHAFILSPVHDFDVKRSTGSGVDMDPETGVAGPTPGPHHTDRLAPSGRDADRYRHANRLRSDAHGDRAPNRSGRGSSHGRTPFAPSPTGLDPRPIRATSILQLCLEFSMIIGASFGSGVIRSVPSPRGGHGWLTPSLAAADPRLARCSVFVGQIAQQATNPSYRR